MPKFPECWETCGSCGNGEVMVDLVHVKVGDRVRTDEPLITLETGKVALDIPSPEAGVIVSIQVVTGEAIAEGALIAEIEPL
jgi:pyruvate/2-oxoglutarate dehydrogenase complex dihydrolipoamide acyltransferase (E2) component